MHTPVFAYIVHIVDAHCCMCTCSQLILLFYRHVLIYYVIISVYTCINSKCSPNFAEKILQREQPHLHCYGAIPQYVSRTSLLVITWPRLGLGLWLSFLRYRSDTTQHKWQHTWLCFTYTQSNGPAQSPYPLFYPRLCVYCNAKNVVWTSLDIPWKARTECTLRAWIGWLGLWISLVW